MIATTPSLLTVAPIREYFISKGIWADTPVDMLMVYIIRGSPSAEKKMHDTVDEKTLECLSHRLEVAARSEPTDSDSRHVTWQGREFAAMWVVNIVNGWEEPGKYGFLGVAGRL